MSQQTAGGFGSARRLIMFAFLLAAILYLMLFHFMSDAVLRPDAGKQNPFAGTQTEIEAALLGEKNIQFHLGDPPANAAADAVPFTRAYFTAVYFHYPQRVFVGEDNKIINFSQDLLVADHLPPPDWLHAHQVSSVFAIYGGSQEKHLQVFEVP